MTRNIFISAGDISGDLHASNLVRALKEIDPGISVASVGGKKLSWVSDTFIFNVCDISAFGFWAVIRHYFLLKGVFKKIRQEWDNNAPQKVVLVDYYGFNIHLAEEAHRRNIPVYYYISPQVWASRKGRIKRLARFVKKMILILPFEEEVYKNSGLDAHFVGHPLLDAIKGISLQLSEYSVPVIGLFPGSRSSVFKRHLPILEKAAELINNKISVNFKIFTPDPSALRHSGKYQLVAANDFSERAKLTFAITTSGTVSLENALLGIPMVVFYRLSWFNYFIAKLIVKVKHIAMPNILLGKELIPELIQSDSTAEKIADTVISMLQNKELLKEIKSGLLLLKEKLGSPGASRKAAQIIME